MIDAILGMSDSIAKGVSEGVQSIAGTELRDFASSMGSISETLSKSKSDVKGLGKVYAEELENIKALDNSLGSVSKQLNDWTEDMNNVLKANLQIQIMF